MKAALSARWDAAVAAYKAAKAEEETLADGPEKERAVAHWCELGWGIIDRTLVPDADALIFKLNLLQELGIGPLSIETFDALRHDADVLGASGNLDKIWEWAEADLAAAEAAMKASPSDAPDAVTDALADVVTSAQVFITKLPAVTMQQALRRIEIGTYDGELRGVNVNALIEDAKALL